MPAVNNVKHSEYYKWCNWISPQKVLEARSIDFQECHLQESTKADLAAGECSIIPHSLAGSFGIPYVRTKASISVGGYP